MFKPQKAKTYGKDKIKDLSGAWRLSKKYDGYQIFIVKKGATVGFFTSNWKQFNIEVIREPLSHLEEDFVLIGEYLYDSTGKLGSRAKSAKITTMRVNHSKNISNPRELEEKSKIMVFDCIKIGAGGGLRTNSHFHYRFQTLQSLKLPKELTIVASHSVTSLEDALAIVDDWVAQGWEGGMLIRPDSPYIPGKQVHHAVKLKGRHTADLLCIGTAAGEGKYKGMIGSLTLRDKAGRVVNVGSGLCDADRNSTKDEYIGKVIEIQYERIDDTYIQPVFIGVREDKTKEEID